MARSTRKPKRKVSGGRYKLHTKKAANLARDPTATRIGETKRKDLRARGGHQKTILLEINTVNIIDPKTKKAKVVKIKTATENPANRNFVKRNILTKGAIIDTEAGKVKITSRPGQEGTLNGVLI